MEMHICGREEGKTEGEGGQRQWVGERESKSRIHLIDVNAKSAEHAIQMISNQLSAFKNLSYLSGARSPHAVSPQFRVDYAQDHRCVRCVHISDRMRTISSFKEKGPSIVSLLSSQEERKRYLVKSQGKEEDKTGSID